MDAARKLFEGLGVAMDRGQRADRKDFLMRRFCALAAVAALVGCCGWGAQAAFASSVFVCVPATAGQSVSSDGNGSTACASGGTRVALPASSADQQTLISILPHISFSAAGVGRKPTMKFSGVNV